jgi:hypothetical protein
MATDLQVPVPADEEQRLRELERYGVIGTASDQHFDRIVALASSILGTPMSAISLVDADRQWFLARKGIALSETPGRSPSVPMPSQGTSCWLCRMPLPMSAFAPIPW